MLIVSRRHSIHGSYELGHFTLGNFYFFSSLFIYSNFSSKLLDAPGDKLVFFFLFFLCLNNRLQRQKNIYNCIAFILELKQYVCYKPTILHHPELFTNRYILGWTSFSPFNRFIERYSCVSCIACSASLIRL